MNIVSNIDLLRHGETVGGSRFYGRTDIAISQQGMAHMWATTQKYSPYWDHIITSPLVRCAEFAQLFAQRYAIPITIDERFKEFNFGNWEGQTAAELMEKDAYALTRFWQNPLTNTPENGEYLLNFQARVLTAWHDIIKGQSGQRILLITHSGVIRTILCHLSQKPIERLLDFNVEHAGIHRVLITQKHGSSHATLETDP